MRLKTGHVWYNLKIGYLTFYNLSKKNIENMYFFRFIRIFEKKSNLNYDDVPSNVLMFHGVYGKCPEKP